MNGKKTLFSQQNYKELYDISINDPIKFWYDQGKKLDWFRQYTMVKNTSFQLGQVSIKWYEDGLLNACYNCVDRHRGDKIAIIYQGEREDDWINVTYDELFDMVCKFSNALLTIGVAKGDVVAIYMPTSIEAAVAMLSCARIGAIHSVIFAGFSSYAVASRIEDCRPKLIITVDGFLHGGKIKQPKAVIDSALRNSMCTSVKNVIVVRSGLPCECQMVMGRDITYSDVISNASSYCECAIMNAEDPLFILYTSGSTGQPKGLLHSTAGYLLFTSITHEYVFDHQPNDIFWCTADIGWITGHSYMVYGPLANGATVVMTSGSIGYPSHDRYKQIINKFAVNTFYTSPTAIRSLKCHNDKCWDDLSCPSLRILGSVGEVLDKASWTWLHDIIGGGKCYITDTWWQTETGGHLIAPIAHYNIQTKAGSVGIPFFGVNPILMDSNAQRIEESNTSGILCIADSWPGQARTMYKNHTLFENTYFNQFPGLYCSGDYAYYDDDGHYWIGGRSDDVINVSGRRLSTRELENAVLCHSNVVEAAIVGYEHSIKGNGIYAYVVLQNTEQNDKIMPDTQIIQLKEAINQYVREKIGSFANLDIIQFAMSLPKTRSGKVMRRILRKIAEGNEDIGDTSTLSNPEIIPMLIDGAKIIRQSKLE